MLHCPLDKFLLDCLRQANPVNIHFLNQSESLIRSFCSTPNQHTLDFPRLNSYYRRIVHCLGRLYGLDHHVEPTNLFNSESTLRSMSLSKGDTWTALQIPLLKCQEFIEIGQEAGLEIIFDSVSEPVKEQENPVKLETPIEQQKTEPVQNKPEPKIKILKRTNQAIAPVTTSPTATHSSQSPQTSIEEREAIYQAARERIFKDFSSNETISSKQLNPNAPVFKAPATEEPAIPEETQSFSHIFHFNSQISLSEAALELFARQQKCFIKVYSIPAYEGIILKNEPITSSDEITIEPFVVCDIK